MNTERLRKAALAIVMAGLTTFAVSCGGDDDPTGPTDPPDPTPTPMPTDFVVKLSTTNSAVGALQFTVTGAGITDVQAASASQVLYTSTGTGSVTAIVAATSIASGDVLTFSVPGGAEVTDFTVALEQVAGTNNDIVASSGYSLAVEESS